MLTLNARRPRTGAATPDVPAAPAVAEPPRFNKGVLSQNVHTRCDLALYLNLFRPSTLDALGLPAPLPTRPNVGLIKDAGVGFETQVYESLLAAFPDAMLHARTPRPTPEDPGAAIWKDGDLAGYLGRAREGTWLVAQSSFSLGPRPAATLRRLGVAEADLPAMPTFGNFIPDLLAVTPRGAGHPCIGADGSRFALVAPRQVLAVVDAKHASEPNPSYEAEVVLYAVILANWLVERGLDGAFAVCAEPLLWTRGGRGLDAVASAPGDTGARVLAVLASLERVNVPVHAQEIRRFLSQKVPRVLAEGRADWRALDWHVSPNCGTCDFLGHTAWLDPAASATVLANPGHYCMTRARQRGHLSRVPGLTKGAAKALRAAGVPDVETLMHLTPGHAAFRGHTLLAKWRRTLPEVARSIEEGAVEQDARRVDGSLPAGSDLTAYVGVDFDGGAGLLTGVAVRTTFFRPRGKPVPGAPQAPAAKPSTTEGHFVVERKEPAAERAAVLGFLRHLAGVLSLASSVDEGPGGGGQHAARATAVTVFWSATQYDALCQAVGRHLPAVLADGDLSVRALAWLFPGESLQGGGGDERSPPVALLRGTARRLLRIPAVHADTLSALVDAYRYDVRDPVLPHPFYADPFTDKVPRERIYEIWSMGDGATRTLPVYPRDPVTKRQMRDAPRVDKEFARADFVDMFGRAILTQARGLESVVRHLRSDFRERLTARAPRIVLETPAWARGVAFDAKLWVARAEFEAAHERAACLSRYLADPDEAEASHEALRLRRLVETRADGAMVYEVEEGSRDAKLRPGSSELCLAFESSPGFAAAAAWQLFPPGGMPQEVRPASAMRMHAAYAATLLEFDRLALLAVVRLREPVGRRAAAVTALRAHLAERGLTLDGGLSLMASMPPDVTVRRLRKVMDEVGDPGIATPDVATREALGLGHDFEPGTSPLVPMARVLWDAKSLEGETALPAARVSAALRAAGAIGLDDSQTRAVSTALSRRLTAIWGPPGTGKTKTLQGFLHGLASEAAASGNPARVLVTGPTYKAVGEVASRLLKGLCGARVPVTVALVGAPDRPMLPEPVDPPGHVSLVTCRADAKDAGFRRVLDALGGDGVTIVCAITHQCARISEHASDLLGVAPRRMLHPLFDTVVVDEASQVDMATAAFPLALMRPGARVVVAGDHLQMPPVQSVEPPKGAERTVGSIQDYLTGRFGVERTPLLVNYRSNDDVVGYCRGLGYPRDLTARFGSTRVNLALDPRGPLPARLAGSWGLPWSPAMGELLPADRGLVALTYPDGVAGQANAFEADLVAAIVLALKASTSRALDGHPDDGEAHGPWDDARFFRKGIGIVTPHRAQKARVVASLCRVFPNADPALVDDAVDTVERFQGGQRHVVLISFGVGDPDVIAGEERFLMGLERTNVAISRAMAKCIVVMSEEVATHIPTDRAASAGAHALRGVVDDWCRNAARHPVPGHPGRTVTARWR